MIRSELAQKMKDNSLDAFLLYLYGMVLKKTSESSSSAHHSEAMAAFKQSIKMYPLNWGAWNELSLLVSDQQSVSILFSFLVVLLKLSGMSHFKN